MEILRGVARSQVRDFRSFLLHLFDKHFIVSGFIQVCEKNNNNKKILQDLDKIKKCGLISQQWPKETISAGDRALPAALRVNGFSYVRKRQQHYF